MNGFFRYFLKRLALGALTVFVLATATFTALHLIPGDPLLSEKEQTPELRASLMKQYHLDQPPLVQYGYFLKDLSRGEFGISFTQPNRKVNDIIRDHFPVSATLGLLAISLAATGGILLGSFSALRRGQAVDRATLFWVILGVSVPNFVIAACLQLAISELNQKTGTEWLPVGGWGSFHHRILPAIVLALGTQAFLTRLMRSSLLEVIHQDYVRTARAKGLSPLRIFFVHQLKNAVLPVLTYLGPSIASVTTGGFVVESVFAIPGLGRYFVQAIQQLDYTVILGLTVFYGSFLVLMVLAVDLLYGLVDPRISLEGRTR